ncbi:MFS transporter [Streptomyces sp. NBC_01017]|uniref:MFS transporter n=1 Tax=Streptomyces sp. NBC_01017 TaxID=2903721 RepID=UPI00386DB356|nr:MFS transporter [Streptomyces sp. NBC_01017]
MAGLNLLPASPRLRRFAYANLVNTIGIGLYLAGSALFFTRAVGLSVGQVALGLGVATGVGLALMMPLGKLADRYGVKKIYLILLIGQAIAMASFTLVDSFPVFVCVAVVSGIAESGVAGTAGAFIHAISEPGERVVGRAQLRTSTNIGLGVGSLLAAGALAVGTATSYTILIAGNSLLFAAAAVLVSRIHVSTQSPETVAPSPAVSLIAPLRDAGYMAVTATNAVLSLHVTVLSFALPLWVANHTQAPVWSVSAVLLVNTGLVVLFQVRVSKSAGTVPTAARAARRAGFFLAASCAVMALTPHMAAWPALVVLIGWAALLTSGELLQSSGEFCFSFNLAPDDAQGVYQSAFALGPGVVRALAPGALTVLVLGHGAIGWLGLACVFVLGGLGTAAAAAWAEQRLATRAVPARKEPQHDATAP